LHGVCGAVVGRTLARCLGWSSARAMHGARPFGETLCFTRHGLSLPIAVHGRRLNMHMYETPPCRARTLRAAQRRRGCLTPHRW